MSSFDVEQGSVNSGPGSRRVPECVRTDGPGFSLCAVPLESSGPGFRGVVSDMKFEKWGEKEPHTKLMCSCEDKVLT